FGGDRSGRSFLRKKYHVAADWTFRKMRKELDALMVRQRPFDEGVERLRIGMDSGMHLAAHFCSCWRNASIWDVCSKVLRLRSRSRGSVPSASSAAALLMPDDCRFLSRSLWSLAVRRWSLRLTVASCTRRKWEISSNVRLSRNHAERRNRSSGGSEPSVAARH